MMLFINNFSETTNNQKTEDKNQDVLLRLNSTAIYEKKYIVDHFNLMFNQLIKMGFKPRIINNCYRLHRFMSLQEAANLLLKDNGKYLHKFFEKNDKNEAICDLCEESIENHSEYIDMKKLDRPDSSFTIDIRTINSNITEKTRTKLEKLTINEEVMEVPLKNEEVIKVESLKLKTCEICLEDFYYSILDEKYKLECGHPYCQTCMDYYLQTEITNGRVKKISCPYKNCTFEITPTHITNIISIINPDLLGKFIKFKKNKELEDNPDTIFCPFPNCEGFNLYENRKNKTATMIKCQFNHEICTRCGEKWHGEKKCEIQLDEEIEKLVLNNKIKLKRCPGCSNWTEKNLGCNHMTCIFCKFQWCWLCNQKYTSNHYTTPSSRCFGKQFPQNNGDFEWENYDPIAYERARLGIQDDPVVNQNAENNNNNGDDAVNVQVIRVPRVLVQEQLTITKFFEELSPTLSREGADSNTDVCVNLFVDCLIFITMAICNFIGNFFMLIYIHKHQRFIRIHNPFRNIFIAKIMYITSVFVIWIIFFITIIGSSIAAFGINMLNSIIQNCKHCSF